MWGSAISSEPPPRPAGAHIKRAGVHPRRRACSSGAPAPLRQRPHIPSCPRFAPTRPHPPTHSTLLRLFCPRRAPPLTYICTVRAETHRHNQANTYSTAPRRTCRPDRHPASGTAGCNRPQRFAGREQLCPWLAGGGRRSAAEHVVRRRCSERVEVSPHASIGLSRRQGDSVQESINHCLQLCRLCARRRVGGALRLAMGQLVGHPSGFGCACRAMLAPPRAPRPQLGACLIYCAEIHFLAACSLHLLPAALYWIASQPAHAGSPAFGPDSRLYSRFKVRCTASDAIDADQWRWDALRAVKMLLAPGSGPLRSQATWEVIQITCAACYISPSQDAFPAARHRGRGRPAAGCRCQG